MYDGAQLLQLSAALGTSIAVSRNAEQIVVAPFADRMPLGRDPFQSRLEQQPDRECGQQPADDREKGQPISHRSPFGKACAILFAMPSTAELLQDNNVMPQRPYLVVIVSSCLIASTLHAAAPTS